MTASSTIRPAFPAERPSRTGAAPAQARGRETRLAHADPEPVAKPRQIERFLRSMAHARDPLRRDEPWITFPAIDWLERVLTPDARVFEFGSGGSTLFFARRVGSLTSVEHHPAWHNRVRRRLRSLGLDDRTRVHLAPPETNPNGSRERFGSTRRTYARVAFEHYVTRIDQEPDASIDLVFVDGRSRMACMRHALPKLKPGGYLVLDNSQRRAYEPVTAELDAAFDRHDFPGIGPRLAIPWRTTAWAVTDEAPAVAARLP